MSHMDRLEEIVARLPQAERVDVEASRPAAWRGQGLPAVPEPPGARTSPQNGPGCPRQPASGLIYICVMVWTNRFHMR